MGSDDQTKKNHSCLDKPQQEQTWKMNNDKVPNSSYCWNQDKYVRS